MFSSLRLVVRISWMPWGRRRAIWADMAAIAHRMSEAPFACYPSHRCLIPRPGGGGLIEVGELERAGGRGSGDKCGDLMFFSLGA